jgi:hypothetical protein
MYHVSSPTPQEQENRLRDNSIGAVLGAAPPAPKREGNFSHPQLPLACCHKDPAAWGENLRLEEKRSNDDMSIEQNVVVMNGYFSRFRYPPLALHDL